MAAYGIALGAACLAADDVRNVDFRNFSYRWQTPGGVPSSWKWLAESPQSTIRLVNGVHRFYGPGVPVGSAPYVMWQSTNYGGLHW